MKTIELDFQNILSFTEKDVILFWQEKLDSARKQLEGKSGPGADYLGWASLPYSMDEKIFMDIEESAKKIKSDSDIFIVIGIGGSYLGARAVIEALCPNFANDKKETRPKIYFAGQNISSGYMRDLLELSAGKEVSLNVISKSGTTTEPGIAFRLLRDMMEKKYGKKAAGRIYATTDKSRGALKKMSDGLGYKTYVVPDDIGGRYSVLTPVGLLPIAVAGINIRQLMHGARDMAESCRTGAIPGNPAGTYAVIRNQLLKSGKQIEVLSSWSPKLHYISEWWKQLFGESEGKEGKGIFPASCDFTTDLHSLGQYLQEGQRILFETFLIVEKEEDDIRVGKNSQDLDELNYLDGKNFDFINKKAAEGTARAHLDGGLPNMTIRIPELSAYYIGQLLYFFELGCALSGYMLGINPFNQPGVEIYKKNMFKLLKKPGY